MHLLKKITACFFVLAALLPLAMAISFLWQQHNLQERMEKRMKQEYLQTLVLHPQEFVWVKAGKEIKIGHRLFDVKTIAYKNNLVVVTGLFDTDEEHLHAALAKYLQKQQNKTGGSQLAMAFVSTTSSQHYLQINILPCPSSRIVYNKARSAHKLFTPKEVNTPPPNA